LERHGQRPTAGPEGPGLDPVDAAIAASKTESCAVCHGGAGDDHQAIYDGYVNESALQLTITETDSTSIAGTCSEDEVLYGVIDKIMGMFE
jgi:hypothetical protein